MTSAISESHKLSSGILSDKVVIMEDDNDTLVLSKEILREVQLDVCEAHSAEEVFKYAVTGNVGSYILDINMSDAGKKAQEGLDALEMIRTVDNDAFVAIISGYSREYQNRAQRLHVNFFRAKTFERKNDIYAVLSERLKYFSTKIKHECTAGPGQAVSSLEIEDANLVAFRKLLSNEEWFEKHLGYYVAFVEGNFIAKDKDRQLLLSKVREEFPEKPKFIAEVIAEENEIIFDFPDRLDLDET
jgi:CheY-like chemotaxis protein